MAEYANLTHESSSLIKRFSHGVRFKKYCDFLRNCRTDSIQSFLDYGTGDGYVFKIISDNGIDGYDLHGYELIDDQYRQFVDSVSKNGLDVVCLKSLDEKKKYDVILCAEVLEHFTAVDLQKHLSKLKDCLSSSGRILISVPIEIGIAGFAKNVVRKLIGETHSGLNPSAIFKSLFDIPIFRGTESYLNSHVGFSYKKLEYLIVDYGFKIERKYFSPIPIFRGFLNSQVFYELSVLPNECLKSD